MKDSNQIIQGFLDVMRQVKELYELLVALSDRKKSAILENNVQELDRIVREEQGTVLRLSQLEKQRIEYVEAFAAEHGRRPEALSMLGFAELCPPPCNTELQKLHDELHAIVQKLSTQNRLHRSLLEGKLAYVRFATDFLTAEQNPLHYGRTGSESDRENRPPLTLIDRKI